MADVLCTLTSLPFAGESFSLVECHHAIEHLGPIHAIYALSECFRVMKPSARLILETPDIEASFRSFLDDRSVASRSSLLSWIFGLDSPGQSHRMLYPERLLRRMLREAGFGKVRTHEPRTHLYREGLRVSAVRLDSAPGTVLARWRQKAIAAGVVDIDDHLGALEMERVLVANLRAFHSDPAGERGRILDAVACSPLGVLLWCETLEEAGCTIAGLGRIAHLAGILDHLDLPARLMREFEASIDSPPGPGDAYDRVLARARKAIGGLARRPARDVASAASRTFAVEGEPGIRAFTRHLVTGRVRWMRDRAVKHMALGRHAEAEELLRLAVNSGIESFYPIVNLAMLRALSSRLDEAIGLYRTALTYRTGEQADALVREELVKCLLHLGRHEEASREAAALRPARLARLWKAVIVYHAGEPAACRTRLAALRRAGFRHDLLATYLGDSRRRGGVSIPPPGLRTEPLVAGEGVHHRLG